MADVLSYVYCYSLLRLHCRKSECSHSKLLVISFLQDFSVVYYQTHSEQQWFQHKRRSRSFLLLFYSEFALKEKAEMLSMKTNLINGDI